ncbi:hypothetical protein LOTGIDRAFT_163128 [Lottia gigantea]|uniref:Uncharacterized protein n=1 Tax=Lottia gigantea TaxID=225164 RepID=V4A9L7_LOTGI|nr:hypothetical protein LOTGIDRAFT_163128 [Lottia gigantea]ESO91770.1 hypothetical protein LOTGIDRAFT_163128 [Lottia gigantea]
MGQKDKFGGLKFQYNSSPPGEAEEIMNAVLSGLVKTEHSHHHHHHTVPHSSERVPCSTTTMMDVSHNYVHQSSRYPPYSPYQAQYYYPQSQSVSPTYYPQHPPFSSNYQSTLSSHTLPSIPSTVYQVQGGSPPDIDGISDEQLDKTLKDLGLLEPSRPKVAGTTPPSHINVHHQRHHLQPSSSCPSHSMCKDNLPYVNNQLDYSNLTPPYGRRE